jgi:hypothetical protein
MKLCGETDRRAQPMVSWLESGLKERDALAKAVLAVQATMRTG